MTTAPVRPRALTAQAAALAVSLMDAAGADGTLPASEVKVGTPLEAPGDGAGTHLFPFGTSGAADATPYLLVHVLPVSCHAVRAGQDEPGAGAWRVELDQPISAYVASGALRLFEVTDA
ncbi:MAG: hypothetical protein ACI379_05755 [Nocardioides sp.]|uniref:hypothetical protein n=1 Tax=Nocardioides sp. TaxID=35761 RepID=UPI003F0860A5